MSLRAALANSRLQRPAVAAKLNQRTRVVLHTGAAAAEPPMRWAAMNRLVVLLLLVALGCAEQFEHRFETGVAALSSELGHNGWVPQWLPSAARNVRLQYDIDTNERWLRFEVDESQRPALVAGLQSVPWAEAGTVRIRRPRRASWWFEGLIQEQPANDGALNADVFRGADRVVLLDRTGPSVFAYVPDQ